MFGRKSNPNSNRPTSNNKKNLSQLGLLDIPDMTNIDDMNNMEDDNDSDLEAELLALTRGNAPKAKKKPKTVVNPTELNKMIQESLRDIPSDEDDSSGEDDPSLMAELQELQSDEESPAPVQPKISASDSSTNSTKTLLEERLKIYQTAEENAKNANDAMKAKRMARGITSLKDLIRKANAGQKINEEDIPPIVSLGAPKPVPAAPPPDVPSKPPEINPTISQVSRTSPSPIITFPESPEEELEAEGEEEAEEEGSPEEVASPTISETLELLVQRQDQYKKAAVIAKQNGDNETALKYVRVFKGFEPVINAVKLGATIDLSSIPPVPGPSPVSVVQLPATPSPEKRENEVQKAQPGNVEGGDIQRGIEHSTGVTTFDVNSNSPQSLMEALQARLKLFQERVEQSKKDNDNAKVRRNERIVKQYQDAIKLHKAGKPIPADELPTPPGFPPLPVNEPTPTPTPSPPVRSPKSETITPQEPKKMPVKSPNQEQRKGSTGFITRNEKQMQLILQKQKLFKMAALKAKQNGDIEKAKEYLRIVKGIEPMIEASKSGIPIDLSSLPLLPEERNNLDEPEPEPESTRLTETMEATDLNVLHKLEADLQRQIELCITTRDHFKAMGDIANANRLDQLALKSKNDLKLIHLAYNADSGRIPKFRYESKSFTIVQCNTDLTDNDVEVTVVQGVNYNVPNPKEIDTYVKLLFPFPTDAPQQYKSGVIYNTNNPNYNVSTIFNMQRNARACQRIFKRQTLKCEIWSRGGFFRSDSLIGTANVKLQPLETQCTVHDAFDLMDGRRSVGGKVEIKIKIRDPILRKQVEKVEEKWLIIDV